MSSLINILQPTNIASVRHISPFRFPGGKTWLVPFIRDYLANSSRPRRFIEPFLGGGSVSMSVADSDLADEFIMTELDPSIAAVWSVLINGSDAAVVDLKVRIERFKCTEDNARALLAASPNDEIAQAFQTIVRNRVQRGGILAPGAGLMKSGEKGKGVSSRWYPQTLLKRIDLIRQLSPRMRFAMGDAFDTIERHRDDENAFWFADPPYTVAGKRAGSRLYAHSQIDHERLLRELASVKGRVMVTYDNTPEVLALADQYGFAAGKIAMRNSHNRVMRELVLTPTSIRSCSVRQRVA